jgi:hypothetical protein
VRKRTFIAQFYSTTLSVFEWTRSGVSLQDSISGLPSSGNVKFSPAGNAIAVGGSVYAWDKSSGIGPLISSTTVNSFSPTGDAVLVGSDIYAFSGSGVGSLLATTTMSGSLSFSQSGNYIVSAGSNLEVQEWDISSGLGTIYSSGFINLGPTRADMGVDDSHLVSLNNSGTLRLHSFDGSSISLTSSKSIGIDSAISVRVNKRMDKILLAANDSSAPTTRVMMLPYVPSSSIGTAYPQPSYYTANSTSDDAVFSASSNIVVFSQLGNFVIAKATSDGWGDLVYSDSASGSYFSDVIEVDA